MKQPRVTASEITCRIGSIPNGVTLKQDESELRELFELMLTRAAPVRTFVELGVYHGGSMFMFASMVHPEGLIIGIDCFDTRPEWGSSLAGAKQVVHMLPQTVVLIEGVTTESVGQVKQHLAGQKIDWLHIDAGHSYACVKRDYEAYKGLMAPGGLIQFHDIQRAAGVIRFWHELKKQRGDHRCSEIGNIGLLALPA